MIKFKLFGSRNRQTAPPIPQPDPAMPEAGPSMNDAQADIEGTRVLLVDDDPVFLKATATQLRAAGFHVRTATESAEAIAALREQPADAVLLDIAFPLDACNGGMASWDGFQLMTWLRGHPSAKGARFIMVSNSGSPDDRQRAEQLGVVAYLQKPLDHTRLFAAMNAEN